jgi:Immunoglobulin domain/CARDB/Immunoglobulin I-set domain
VIRTFEILRFTQKTGSFMLSSRSMVRGVRGRSKSKSDLIEFLEGRLLLSASPGLAYGPDTWIMTPSTAATAAPAAATPATQPNHLVINPIWDSTITSDPNSAAIEAVLNTMIGNFESDYTTPITVTVKFKEITSGLAQSQTAHIAESYSAFVAALKSHATSANDKTAVATLPTGTKNPVNGATSIVISDPNARALGFTANPTGGIDSTIGLNMSQFNLSRFSADINPDKYDLIGSSSHEMDEVLGIDSALDSNNANEPIPTTFVCSEDLFRYDVNSHARSFTINPNVEAAFSFSGGSSFVARFNQTKGDDYNDWYSPGTQAPQVQDAVGTPGATPNLGTELTVLDVLGYTLAPGVIGGFKPDLVPDALNGWSSPLVLTTTNGSVTDSATLPTTSTIYLDAAVRNRGEAETTAAETNIIKLDGKTIFTFNDPAGLAVNSAYFSVGLSLGKLSPGTHTISITADSNNTINEIIESNNTFTRTFTVTTPVVPLPDLTPYTPTGWSSPLVVNITATSTTDAPLITTADTVFVDFAYINDGNAPVTKSFDVVLKLDGKTAYTLNDTQQPLNAGFYDFDKELNAGKITAGTHTLEMIVDSNNAITESNEKNNTYTRTFTVSTATKPAITKQPVSQSIPSGNSVTFTAAASGNPPPKVQWQLSTNGGSSYSNISGATSTSYTFTTKSSENGYHYRAVFTNSDGSATTSAATLTVTAALVAPTITKQPTAAKVAVGAKVTFTAAASGIPTPTVQWQISTNGGTAYSNISDATSTTYSFIAKSSQNNDLFRAVFTNSKGSKDTSAVKLVVT